MSLPPWHRTLVHARMERYEQLRSMLRAHPRESLIDAAKRLQAEAERAGVTPINQRAIQVVLEAEGLPSDDQWRKFLEFPEK